MTSLAQGSVPYPDDGDATAPERVAAELAGVMEALGRAGAPLDRIVGSTREVWNGAAASRFDEQTRERAAQFAGLLATVRHAVPVLQTFAAATATTRARYGEAVGREHRAAAAGEWGRSARIAAIADEQACVAAQGQATARCVTALLDIEARLRGLSAGRALGSRVGAGVSDAGAQEPGVAVAGAADAVPNTTPLTDEDFRAAAERLGVDEASIRAVAEVESVSGGFLDDGRPRILYERHYFRSLTDGRFNRSHPELSGPARRAGTYGTLTRQHDRLEAAMVLDREAALQSASWGRFQIMGKNYAAAGYGSIDAFVADAHAGEGGQLRMFVGFIESDDRLHDSLRRRDWAAFARIYNGPNYRQNRYDDKMAAAYTRYAGE